MFGRLLCRVRECEPFRYRWRRDEEESSGFSLRTFGSPGVPSPCRSHKTELYSLFYSWWTQKFTCHTEIRTDANPSRFAVRIATPTNTNSDRLSNTLQTHWHKSESIDCLIHSFINIHISTHRNEPPPPNYAIVCFASRMEAHQQQKDYGSDGTLAATPRSWRSGGHAMADTSTPTNINGPIGLHKNNPDDVFCANETNELPRL